MKLISFDLQSEFGFFRKPESNNTLNVSYNIIHRPAVLGILGAIIGMEGYREKGLFPEYYEKLKHLRIGIAPLNHGQGNYLKTPIKYSNTVGYANKGANFLTEELTLISPKYRIFLMLNPQIEEEKILLHNLETAESEFIPYLGKNEFTAWWDNFQEYSFSEVDTSKPLIGKVATVFIRNQVVTKNTGVAYMGILDMAAEDFEELPYFYFERLPIDFDHELIQYRMEEMVFTNQRIKNLESFQSLWYLEDSDTYVQLL